MLLDTHVLLWALAEPRRLDRETRSTIESGETEVLFSAASIWEIAIKAGLGRGDFTFDPAEIARAALDAGLTVLANSDCPSAPPRHQAGARSQRRGPSSSQRRVEVDERPLHGVEDPVLSLDRQLPRE